MSIVGISPLKRSVQMVVETNATTGTIRNGITGTFPTSTSNFLVAEHFPIGSVEDFTPRTSFDPIDIPGSRTQSKEQSYRGQFTGGIDVTFDVTNWRHANAFMGNYDGMGNTTYMEHTMSPDVALPYLSLYGISQQTNMDIYAGCWGESITWVFPKSQVVKANATFQALEYTSDTAVALLSPADAAAADTGVTPTGGGTPPTEALVGDIFRFTDGTTSFAITLNIDGGGATSFTSYTHEIEIGMSHTIARAPAYDELFGDYFTMSDSEVSCKMTVDIYDQTAPEIFQEIVDQESEVVMVLTTTRGTNDNAVFTLPRMKLYDFPKNWDESVRVDLTWDVLHDEIAGNAISLVTQDAIIDYSYLGV